MPAPLNDLQARIGQLLTLVVRGVSLRQPVSLSLHGHGTTLFVRATLEMQVPETEPPVLELSLRNCPNFTLSPATDVLQEDFNGQWPPADLISALDRKIILPGGAKRPPKLVVAK